MPVEKLKMMAVNNRYRTRPDLFSRVSLELTFRLLRSNNARLALEVQNLLQGNKAKPHTLQPSHSSNTQFLGDLQADYFYVTLSPQDVGKVVDALTRLGQDLLNTSTPSSKRLIICTLIKDWICLTEWLLLQAERPAQAFP